MRAAYLNPIGYSFGSDPGIPPAVMMIDKIMRPRRATILMSENQNSACALPQPRSQLL